MRPYAVKWFFIKLLVLMCAGSAFASMSSSVTKDNANPKEVHVDQGCSALGDENQNAVYLPQGFCRIESAHQTQHKDGATGHVIAIVEQVYVLTNATSAPMTFIVEHTVPEGWHIDSDPAPEKMVGTIAYFRVITQPGETVRLHVGKRLDLTEENERQEAEERAAAAARRQAEAKPTTPIASANPAAPAPHYQRQPVKAAAHPSLASLIVDAKSPDAETRSNAVLSLGTIENSRTVPPLIVALHDVDPQIRHYALRGLSGKHDPRSFLPILSLMDDPQAVDLRGDAMLALRGSTDPRIIEPMIRALKDHDELVREVAARALGNTADPRAIEPLIASLPMLPEQGYKMSDPNMAAESLAKIGDPAIPDLVAALQSPLPLLRARAAETLGLIRGKSNDTSAIEPLAALLNDPDLSGCRPKEWRPAWQVCYAERTSPVRESAAVALASFHDPRAVEPLIKLVRRQAPVDELCDNEACTALVEERDERRSYDDAAINGLGSSGDPRAVAYLIGMMRNDVPYARYLALEALGNSSSAAALDVLIDVLDGSDLKMADGAARALGHMQAPRALAALLDSIELHFSISTLNALQNYHDARIIPYLIQQVRARTWASDSVEKSLQSYGTLVVAPLLPLLQDPNPQVRQEAAQILVAVDDPRVAAAFRKSLYRHDLDVVIAARTYYLKQNDPHAWPILILALNTNGFRELANEFMANRSPKLQAAAIAWVGKNHCSITTDLNNRRHVNCPGDYD